MSNKILTVSASLTNGQRTLLLRRFSPRFENVFCVQVTYAYDVLPDFEFPRQRLDLTLTGIHLGDGHEALAGSISDPLQPISFGTRNTRPDGKLIHVTLSTADGMPPARAGNIDAAKVTPIAPVVLQIQLHRRGASRITPTRLAA